MPDRYHMTPDEFRKHGHELVDWVADYLDRVESYPVLSVAKPGDIRSGLPRHPPREGETFGQILQDLDQIIMPGITHWQSPNFFAFFNGNSSGPSILGELAAAGLGTQGMLWATSPAATELEVHVLDWLADMLGLPNTFRSDNAGGGVIQDSASSSTLTAVLAARERATGFSSNRIGNPGTLTMYASSQAHSSIEKAIRIAGLGSDSLRLVEVDGSYAMRPDRLEELITADRTDGHTPAFVCATVGTTSSLAMDPVRAIGEIARRHGLWLHVDAAWAGTAAVCPEFRRFQDGLELADSYVVNPHKWMFTNFDCSAFYVADRKSLIKTMGILPEYLRNEATESGEVVDYRDWHVPLGRRFRALKLWFVIRHYGVEGIQHHIREHVRLGQDLASKIDDHPDFELAAPVPLNLVCFRHVAGDATNRAIIEAVNAGGGIYMTHTKLDDRVILRLNIGQTNVEERHVARAWELIQAAAQSVA